MTKTRIAVLVLAAIASLAIAPTLWATEPITVTVLRWPYT